MAKSKTKKSSTPKLGKRVEDFFTTAKYKIKPYIPTKTSATPSVGSHLVDAIGWGLFTSFLFHIIWQCNTSMHQFGNSLTVDQLQMFKKICRHRAWITVWALVISFIPAIFITYGCHFRIGHFFAFWFMLTGFVYYVWPKKAYMLNHIQTPQQASQWFAIYLCMKQLCMTGFLVGFILSLFVSYISYPAKEQTICNILS